jgi:S-adenosylmethionine:tRNA ribosyltransferase-isomerase
VTKVADFDFHLPPELIAQTPAPERDAARLLVLDRATGRRDHSIMSVLPDRLRPGDLLVANDTRVFPARLLGLRDPTGGAVECLLLQRIDSERWEALVHPGQRLDVGSRLSFSGEAGVLRGEIVERRFRGRRVIRLWADAGGDVDAIVDAIGHVPLPPYIRRAATADDRERYQTVFAAARGSVAAPTAGLHFTAALLRTLISRGVEVATITLHVGYGTFKPVRADRVEDHVVDPEHFSVTPDAAAALTRARRERRRIIAVGTTTVRTLESLTVGADGAVTPASGETSLFIRPGHRFQLVDGMITNFHLPRSSLLMLVAALAGRERILDAYREAVDKGYRFYSYGDAMLIV